MLTPRILWLNIQKNNFGKLFPFAECDPVYCNACCHTATIRLPGVNRSLIYRGLLTAYLKYRQRTDIFRSNGHYIIPVNKRFRECNDNIAFSTR